MNKDIRISTQATQEIISLLKKTIWGQKGTQFIHLNIENRIKSNPENIYFSYYVEQQIAGVVVFCIRQCESNQKSYNYVYTRYFSVAPKFRGNKIGQTLLEEATTYFNQQYKDTPTLFYAYIDKKNLRSSKIAQNLAYDSFSEFKTHIFSRIKPKKSVDIREIDFNTLVYFGEFNNHNAFPNHEINNTKCYGYYLKNQLIAGFRILPTQWKIEKLSGFQGFVLKNIVSRIPFINKVFDREIFDFLAIDHIYLHKNCSSLDIQKLIESVLHQENKHIAISWLDTKDTTNPILQQIPNKGILDKFNTEVPANIHFTHLNMEEREMNHIYDKPFFIVSADLT